MPNLLSFDPVQILGFLVILSRISGVVISAPILGDQNIPPQIKVAFAFVLSLVFYPVLTAPQVPVNPGVLDIVLITGKEVAVGLLIGFTARMLFAGVTLAGEVTGFQMGLGVANIFDPSSEQQVSLVGQIQVIFALFLFVVMDGHHLFIRSLVISYRFIKPGEFTLTEPLYQHMVRQGAAIFIIGLQIGAPLIVALIAANFSIGLMARSVPQMNVVVVGFPFTIILGLLLLALGFPFFIEAVSNLHNQLEGILATGLRNG